MGDIKMTENITKEEMEKARDAFYSGDIGSDTETGYKLLNKDEETINLIGKVLINLVEEKLKEEEGMDCDKAYNSVMDLIAQFKDTKKQEEYRYVINTIFKDFAYKRDLVGS